MQDLIYGQDNKDIKVYDALLQSRFNDIERTLNQIKEAAKDL